MAAPVTSRRSLFAFSVRLFDIKIPPVVRMTFLWEEAPGKLPRIGRTPLEELILVLF